MPTYADLNSVQNPTPGATILAAWGDQARDDLEFLHGRARCRVRRGGAQSIPNTTLTTVLFDQEDIDTHAAHSTVSNTGRITIPAGWGGDWMVGATVQWNPNTGGVRRHAEIHINGGGIKIVDDECAPDATTGYSSNNLSTMWFPVATDYFELKVYQDSGGNLDANSDGYAGTIFWAYWLGEGVG